jgi:hypothetical protein
MICLPYENTTCEQIFIDSQIAMNITANHSKILNGPDQKMEKTKGLLYQDLICCDNILILMHGKIITTIDLSKKEESCQHYDLMIKPSSFYDFSHEPICIWMNDKEVTDIKERWKTVVAFKNG